MTNVSKDLRGKDADIGSFPRNREASWAMERIAHNIQFAMQREKSTCRLMFLKEREHDAFWETERITQTVSLLLQIDVLFSRRGDLRENEERKGGTTARQIFFV